MKKISFMHIIFVYLFNLKFIQELFIFEHFRSAYLKISIAKNKTKNRKMFRINNFLCNRANTSGIFVLNSYLLL